MESNLLVYIVDKYSKVVFLTILVILFSCEDNSSFKDKNSVENVMQNYREAWKSGDTSIILSSLSEDIILFMPTKEGLPIFGKDSVAKFWFPQSEISYPILDYKVSNKEIITTDSIAFYQGTSILKWYTLENEVARDTTISVSEFVNLLKWEDENWKLFRIMYTLKDQDYFR